MKKTGIFVRTTSGLRRDWSPLDLFLYNWMTGNFIFTTILFVGLAQMFGSFPGADLFLAITLGGIGAIPVLGTYAMLSASMPRAGGDYIWVSRILHPMIGFIFTMAGATALTLLWMPWNGYNAATIGFASAFGIIGNSAGNVAWTNASAWFLSVEGQYVIVALSIIIPALMIAFGMRKYALIQRGIFIVSMGCFAVMIGLLLSSNPTAFAEGFNKFAGPGGYQKVLDVAQEKGMGPTAFSAYGTAVLASYMAVGYSWNFVGNSLLGEVKSASNLRNMMLAFVLPPILSILMFCTLFASLFATVGRDFLASLGFLMSSGDAIVTSLPFQPYFLYLPTLVLSQPVLTGVVLFIMFGMVLSALFYNVGNILLPSRYFFAQSFDRLLPSVMSSVHTRWRTPWVAIGVASVAAMLWWVFSLTYPNIWLFFSATGIAIFIYEFIVCAAGMVFPFRQPVTYASSPLAKYKIAGIPLVSITGFLGMVYNLVFTILYLAIPALGITGYPPSFIMVIAVFIAAALYYYIMKWYRFKHGIDVTLAFQEVPPL